MFKEIYIENLVNSIPFDEYRDNPEPSIFFLSGTKTIELNQLKLEFLDNAKKLLYYFNTGSKYPIIKPEAGDIPDGVKALIYSHKKGFDVLFLLPGSFVEGQRHQSALIYYNGYNLGTVVRKIVESLMQLTGRKTRFLEDKPKVPKWFQTIGWSTFPAYGEQLSHEKVMNAVWSLKQYGYTPGYVLLQQGWQNENDGALIDFGSHSEKFPSGLKGLMKELEAIGVKHLGVWLPVTGAGWRGLAPELSKKYLGETPAKHHHLSGHELGTAFEFFHDYYKSLRNEGVSFVQIGEAPEEISFPIHYENLQCAIEAAAVIHFDCPPLNADGLDNENPLFWPISPISRIIDVKTPDNLEEIQQQIRLSLLNATFYQDLLLPDFGPWCTKSPYSEMQALFHSLSRTIHLLGDPPGDHQKLLLKKLALPSGRMLQADSSPSVSSSCLFIDPENDKEIFKACTLTRGCGALALFNLCNTRRSLKGTVSLDDFNNLVGNLFAVYSHRHGFVGVLKHDEELEVSLKPDSCDMLLFCPVQKGVAVVGFHDFYLSPAPILQIDIEDQAVHITAKIVGPLLLYSEKEVLEVRRNGLTVSWEYDKERKTLSIESASNVIESQAAYTILFES